MTTGAKRLLVFGAAGRTGRALVDLAAAAGFTVTACGRTGGTETELPAGAERASADVLAPAEIRAVLAAARPDMVVSTIGGRMDLRVDDEGVRNIADACLATGVARLIAVTSLGCGGSAQYASERLMAAIGEVLAAKTRAEAHITGLPLGWTIVRPAGLLDEPATGRGALFDDERVHGRIACRDLAALLLRLCDDDASVGRILSAVDEATLNGPDDPVRYQPATA
jgi:nucleoside-diphosphate-sugar epimerase